MWRLLNTPDDFRRDWYGELTNQGSHTLLGVVVTVLFLSVWREVTGEMPVRSWTFLLIFLSYAIGIEAVVQKWQPGDAWFDAIMLGCGCAVVLLPFKEVAIDGALTVLTFDHRYALGIIAVWAVMLWVRVKKRYDAG